MSKKNLFKHALRQWTGLLLLAALTLLAGGCSKKKVEVKVPLRPVTTAKAEQGDVPLYIDSIGKCIALKVVSIQPQVSGQLMEAHFKQGEEVPKDKLLFTIDPRPYKAVLDKAEAQLANDQAQLKINEANLRRSRELVAGEYISPQNIETLEATVASNKAQVQADNAAIDKARVDYEFCFVRAPVNGRTGLYLVDVGNIVAPGGNSSMVSLQTLDPIYVDFVAVEKDLPVVNQYATKTSLKVEVRLVNNPQFRREGELLVVDNTVQKGTGTVNLRAIIPNQDRALWPEQFVNARLILSTLKNVVLVPAEAVKDGQLGRFVFVVKPDSTVELRIVEVGQAQGERIIIAKGVQAGETVVVTGQLTLNNGARVEDVTGKKPSAPATKLAK